MTFVTLDDLMGFLDQVAADRMRECETRILLHADTFDDDDLDAIDLCHRLHDAEMGIWRIETRRRLETLPFRFPLTVTWSDRQRLP